MRMGTRTKTVSYTHLRAHETPEHLVCRLLLETKNRTEFWEMLAGLKAEGITMIVSTPYMDEAFHCDRIALIQSGAILSIDTPDNIRRSYNQKLYAVKHPFKYKLLLA